MNCTYVQKLQIKFRRADARFRITLMRARPHHGYILSPGVIWASPRQTWNKLTLDTSRCAFAMTHPTSKKNRCQTRSFAHFFVARFDCFFVFDGSIGWDCVRFYFVNTVHRMLFLTAMACLFSFCDYKLYEGMVLEYNINFNDENNLCQKWERSFYRNTSSSAGWVSNFLVIASR